MLRFALDPFFPSSLLHLPESFPRNLLGGGGFWVEVAVRHGRLSALVIFDTFNVVKVVLENGIITILDIVVPSSRCCILVILDTFGLVRTLLVKAFFTILEFCFGKRISISTTPRIFR